MAIIFTGFFSIVSLVLMIHSLDHFADTMLEAKSRWQESYQHLVCARLAVMEQNLTDAQEYLAQLDARPEAITLRQVQAGSIIQTWREAVGAEILANCPEVFELYRQTPDRLPPYYPNWWIRWLYEEEMQGGLGSGT